jgi:hypothetical protein
MCDDFGESTIPFVQPFFIVPSLGYEIILGVPALLGPLYDYFTTLLRAIHEERKFCVNEAHVLLIEDVLESSTQPGAIVDPWEQPLDPPCMESELTPDPVSIPDDILQYLETTHEDASKEYVDLLDTHVSVEMKNASPEIVPFLRSSDCMSVFVPEEWLGLRIPPIGLTLLKPLPDRLTPRARPIRPALYDNAKKEFDRLRKYFYVESCVASRYCT